MPVTSGSRYPTTRRSSTGTCTRCTRRARPGRLQPRRPGSPRWRAISWSLLKGKSLVDEEFGDAGPGQPPAAERPSFLLDQAAPYPVSADTARVPQREFQAVRAYRAAGAAGDGLSRLVPGLGHVVGYGKPVVRIDGRTGAPGLPVHPAGQFTVGQVARLTPSAAWPRGHQHPLPLPPCGQLPGFVAQSSSRCRWSASPDQLVSRVQGLSMSGMRARGWRRQGGAMDLTLGVRPGDDGTVVAGTGG